MSERVLVVEDDTSLRASVADFLRGLRMDVTEAGTCAQARQAIEHGFDLVLCDIKLPDGDGLALLEEVIARHDVPVVVMTAFPEIQTATRAVRLGAYDYLHKPFDLEHLDVVLRRALEHRKLRTEVARLRHGAPRVRTVDDLVGDSPAALALRARVLQLGAASDSTVLVTGETGTGKELCAEALHSASPRAGGPFVRVNCPGLPPSLFEAELFGHARGAFTGATGPRKGLVELAEGGSLFLDEIGDVPLDMQAKILRFVDSRSFRRVGGGEERRVDVRVIAATNRDLAALVGAQLFREDLYFRLAVLDLPVPPLRERGEDVEAIAVRFLADMRCRLGRAALGFSPSAFTAMTRYRWPGNVRELRNVVERSAVLATGALIADVSLRRDSSGPPPGDVEALPLAEVERRHVLAIYERSGRNKTRAAQTLGLSRVALRERLRRYGADEVGGS